MTENEINKVQDILNHFIVFFNDMIKKMLLPKNLIKDTWKQKGTAALRDGLEAELRELDNELIKEDWDVDAIVKEAADIGNYAAMIGDRTRLINELNKKAKAFKLKEKKPAWCRWQVKFLEGNDLSLICLAELNKRHVFKCPIDINGATVEEKKFSACSNCAEYKEIEQ